MKKKHKIKSVQDIKHCEEKCLTIYSKTEDCFYEFYNGIWCRYDKKGYIRVYNATLYFDTELYYYEEQEQQEASEKDLGCLCYCWDTSNEEKDLGVLKDYDTSDDDKYHIAGLGYYKHCRRLTPSEVAEITGYKVEKAE